MALDHVAKVRVLPGQPLWRYRLGVRTGGSQPSNRGSIPRSAIVGNMEGRVCVVRDVIGRAMRRDLFY